MIVKVHGSSSSSGDGSTSSSSTGSQVISVLVMMYHVSLENHLRALNESNKLLNY